MAKYICESKPKVVSEYLKGGIGYKKLGIFMSTEPNSFSKYLVIFVNILGSQNRTDFQEMYQINKIFYD